MSEAEEIRTDDALPRGQNIFDNVWLWLALGIGVPTLFYIAWGLVDLLLLPEA